MHHVLITQQGLLAFHCSRLHLPCNSWEEFSFLYKKLHFGEHRNRTKFRIHSPIVHQERRQKATMFGIGKKLAEEATQQAEHAAQVAVNTAGQTVQQVVEQAKEAGQKALDEVNKVAETGEKAVKNVTNQATAWGKSFCQ
ncbi:adipogenesis regulatory factor-like [Rhea pennata]|uniref:adipogenesis regulatory factor-like n=1 Tax=Rhea pennata TaxID=8795 RepID=UPI002E26936E